MISYFHKCIVINTENSECFEIKELACILNVNIPSSCLKPAKSIVFFLIWFVLNIHKKDFLTLNTLVSREVRRFIQKIMITISCVTKSQNLYKPCAWKWNIHTFFRLNDISSLYRSSISLLCLQLEMKSMTVKAKNLNSRPYLQSYPLKDLNQGLNVNTSLVTLLPADRTQ